jgi:hypothetical protein
MRTRTLVPWLLTLVVALSAYALAQEGIADLPMAWAAGRSDALASCLPLDATSTSASAIPTPDHTVLARTLASVTRDTRIGTPLLEHAARLGTGVCLDAYDRACDGVFSCDQNVILLDADLSDGLRTAILVHELRHVDQAAAGYRMDMDYDVHAARTLLCACEADAQAMATWFAWRLREAGDPRPWRALRAHPHYADIAGAFEAAILLGGSEPTAAHVAFDAWYASDWRVWTYRFTAAMAYYHRQDKDDLVPTDRSFPDDYFASFGLLPDGSSYGATPRDVR